MLKEMGNAIRYRDRLLVAYRKTVVNGAVFGGERRISFTETLFRKHDDFKAIRQYFPIQRFLNTWIG